MSTSFNQIYVPPPALVGYAQQELEQEFVFLGCNKRLAFPLAVAVCQIVARALRNKWKHVVVTDVRETELVVSILHYETVKPTAESYASICGKVNAHIIRGYPRNGWTVRLSVEATDPPKDI